MHRCCAWVRKRVCPSPRPKLNAQGMVQHTDDQRRVWYNSAIQTPPESYLFEIFRQKPIFIYFLSGPFFLREGSDSGKTPTLSDPILLSAFFAANEGRWGSAVAIEAAVTKQQSDQIALNGFCNRRLTLRFLSTWLRNQCDQKKSSNVYKSCPEIISLKMINFDTFTKIDYECGEIWAK